MPPQVPITEILPADIQTEIRKSVPLPPPIIPETEECTPSPVSEASSGYISTSVSTVTLSDVYTLSWDLPQSSGFDMVPDENEEDYKVTKADSHPGPSLVDQDSLAVVNDKALAERTDTPLSQPNNTPSGSDLSQQEPNQVQSVQLKDQGEPASVAESDSTTDQTEPDQSDPLKDSAVVEEDETKPAESDSKSETPTPEELEPALTDRTEAQTSPQDERQLSTEGQVEQESIAPQTETKDEATLDGAQDPEPNLIPEAEDKPAPVQPGDSVPQDSSKDEPTFEISDPNRTSTPPPSSTTDTIQQESPAPSPPTSNQASKPAASASNPFKIQKVKSSDLKSFKPILNEEEAGNADWKSSLETGLNLSVPVESLEIISDSEEGDATAVLPDWLKEGEFVTVGTNKSGTVRYVGPTDFAKGTWVGVELEVPAGEWNRVLPLILSHSSQTFPTVHSPAQTSHKPILDPSVGKNDGSVGGKHYFHCNPGYGVLVRPDRVTRGGAKRRRQQQKRRSANLSGSSPNLAALTALAKGEPSAAAAAGRSSKGENRKSWNT